ncbi:MAG: bifunctional nicotinamidase/pyrazinamidase [Candidatus Lokiarchaeota archaeon]
MDISDLKITKSIVLSENDALIIVDMQYDFLPGGSLEVKKGDEIIDGINSIGKIFSENLCKVVLTQDWHPKNHLSFASNHPGKKPGDEYSTDGIGPVLWPDHCVQSSEGAKFHKDLNSGLGQVIIRKGVNPKVDSYSAFRDKQKKQETGLKGYLKSLKIKRIFICGLALDYCCYYTALDAVEFGFEPYLLINLTRGIDAPEGSISRALKDMQNNGIKFARSLESFN